MSAGKRRVCGAEAPVPEQLVQHLWTVCGRDVSKVVVRCFLTPQHPRVTHAGRLLNIGEIHW